MLRPGCIRWWWWSRWHADSRRPPAHRWHPDGDGSSRTRLRLIPSIHPHTVTAFLASTSLRSSPRCSATRSAAVHGKPSAASGATPARRVAVSPAALGTARVSSCVHGRGRPHQTPSSTRPVGPRTFGVSESCNLLTKTRPHLFRMEFSRTEFVHVVLQALVARRC
eukprot:scaffold47912_cov73-Phaeocystis_antarctica.AAC.5